MSRWILRRHKDAERYSLQPAGLKLKVNLAVPVRARRPVGRLAGWPAAFHTVYFNL
jgi:hypothetical protein